MRKSYASKKFAGSVLLGKDGKHARGILDMELTERCNNNCAHCCVNLPADDHSARARELSTEEVVAILKETAAVNHLGVRFTGGEPLLREDFVQLYLGARRMGLKVMLFTNATLITPELADLFARIPPLELIEVTVYGMTREAYEAASRTPGSFEAAWRGIQLLLDRKVPFHVKGAMLPHNRLEINDFKDWASTIPWMKRPPSYSVYFDLRCRRDDSKKNDLIRRLRLSPDEGLAIVAADRDGYLKERQQFAAKFTYPPGEKLFVCVPGGCIDPYGYLHVCITMRNPDMAYNLREGSLEDALTAFLPKIGQLDATNPDYLERCAQCFLKGLCEQCPAKSWAEHGTLDTPVEYFCQVGHAEARYLGLLDTEEKAWQVTNWRQRLEHLAGEEWAKAHASSRTHK